MLRKLFDPGVSVQVMNAPVDAALEAAGTWAGLAAFIGVAVFSLLSFVQARVQRDMVRELAEVRDELRERRER